MGARFVRLGIAGFKSFADPVTLDILPGLTGVVGPNGCGKSNVAEALRWAMGEANARHLRGGEMDDVIFAGSAHRPARNLAEVSLQLESDDTGLPPPYGAQSELQVVRRIERGGGSAYRVDGREARARDVQTLFADLASGARSSAMVSQGRVGALVNARPEERRALLEEAAGITGLHARRAEAEMRLRATETNLDRAEERRALLEQQLAALQVQARQAARYRAVVDSAAETEAGLLAIGLARATAAHDAAVRDLEAAQSDLAQAQVAALSGRAAAERAKAAVPALREVEAETRTTFERARLAADGAAAEAARAREALAAAAARHSQLAHDLHHAETVLSDADAADARLVTEAERLRGEADAHPALLTQARREAEHATTTLLAADETATAAAAQAAEASAQAGALRQRLDEATQRARRADETRTRLDGERAKALARVVDDAVLHATLAAHTAAADTLQVARLTQERAEAERTRALPAAAAAREAYARQDAVRHRCAAETAALAEVLAVKDGERWPPMVDRLHVPAGMEAALGAALGEELAAADDPSASRHWRPLPALPLVAMPGRRLDAEVSGPELMARALGGIGLVGSDAEGDAGQPALRPGQCLVSAGGAVWRWDGYTVRAGTPTAAAVRLRQRNRLGELRAGLAAAERDAAAARTRREAAEQAERGAVVAEQRGRIARRDAEAAFERTRAAAASLSAEADSARSRVATLEEQLASVMPECDAAAAALNQAQAAHRAQIDPAALHRAASEARARVGAARAAEVAAHRATDGLLRTESARLARMAGIGREREDRRLRVADLQGRVVDLRARQAESAREQAQLAEAPDRIARAATAARGQVQEAEARTAAAAAARAAAEQAAETADARARASEGAGYALREALVRAEGALLVAQAGHAASLARIAERESALPSVPPPAEVTQAAEDRARTRLHRLLRERDEIGPVNLRADHEAAALEADIALIVREREELATAIAKLRGSIGHLNREGRERLSAVFHQVDRHFQTLFSRMFGGGRAHLALLGSDDPLLAGLEIYAQPPGKKLASLALLSGGEQALTALSLVFAVFLCNPAPLCVLDEVDAPLDDANVERFCALLSDMVQQTGTRFLVVTHHQLTMARMDRLYGVTMQERGISRLLSVDLSRAAAMVGAVAAE